jgi:hypothetical protein
VRPLLPSHPTTVPTATDVPKEPADSQPVRQEHLDTARTLRGRYGD